MFNTFTAAATVSTEAVQEQSSNAVSALPAARGFDITEFIDALADGRPIDDDLISIEDMPTQDVKAVARYTMGLYALIFVRMTPRTTYPIGMSTLQEVWRLVRSSVDDLAKSHDDYIADWAKNILPSTSDVESVDPEKLVNDLPIIAARTGLLRYFEPSPIYHLVMAVYGSEQKEHWSGSSAIPIINSMGRLTYVTTSRLETISNIGVPRNLPLFWRFMFIVFSKYTVDGAEMDASFMAVWRQVVRVMALSAQSVSVRELSSASIMRKPLKRTASNVVASFMVTSMFNPMNDTSSSAAARIMSNISMRMGVEVVDAAFAAQFVERLITCFGKTPPEEFEGQEPLLEMLWRRRSMFMQPYAYAEWNQTNGYGRLLNSSQEAAVNDDSEADAKDDVETTNTSSDAENEDLSFEDDEEEDTPTPEGEDESTEDPETGDSGDHYMTSGTADAEEDNSEANLTEHNEGNDAFYRAAVLKAYDELSESDEETLDPADLAKLRNWCVYWLWLAPIKDTKELVSALGLKPIFE